MQIGFWVLIMGKFNNYGGYVGKQNGGAGSFNNVGCTIGEQVVNNGGKKENKKHQEELNKRMKELEARMQAMKNKCEGL